MAKYKVGDIFINHNDGKILQVREGDRCKDCCYNKAHCEKTCSLGASCLFLIGTATCLKELFSLPPDTKVKMREDLKVGTEYGDCTFVADMQNYKEVTIKDYFAFYRCYKVYENDYHYIREMFDQVINEPKTNNMETKEIKINVPEGYEIDEENSTFECIKLKPIKKELTYEDVAEELFSSSLFTLDTIGRICNVCSAISKFDKYNATSKKQLERLLALNQLFNIAEYYNRKNPKEEKKIHCINYDIRNLKYFIQDYTSSIVVRGLVPIFNNKEDAQAVINNPYFKEILDLIYKCDED